MAEDKKSGSLKKRTSIAVVYGSCARYRKPFLCVIILAVGFICGHMLHRLATQTEILSVTKVQPNGQKPRRFAKNESTDNATVEVLLEKPKPKPSVSVDVKNPHEPQKEREGLSIKKDMSIQFRDYKPKNIFVNCGGKFPDTLHLFCKTYPKSYDYELYSFIADDSYRIFYQNFQRHTLFAPFIVSTQNATEQATIHGFASMRQLYDNVPTIDIAAWLKTYTRPDDFVIFKLDSKKDLDIVNKLVESDAIERIDKFYTTNLNNDTIQLHVKKMKPNGLSILTWNNIEMTYNDFGSVNKPKVPLGGATYMTKCYNSADKEQFALLLYAKQVTPDIEDTLKMLQTYGRDRKVAVSLFLPTEFYKRYHLHSLFSSYTMGLYLGNTFEDKKNINSTNAHQNYYRNMVVEGNHYFEKLNIPPLQYVMTPVTFNDDVVQQLNQDRRVTVFKDAKDITNKSELVIKNGELTIDMIGRLPGEYLSVDLAGDNSDILSLYVIKRFEPWLIPMSKCQTSMVKTQ